MSVEDQVEASAEKMLAYAGSVAGTLKNRHGIHGDFKEQAYNSMQLLDRASRMPNWDRLDAGQREALILIFVKIGRILTGDHNTADHWHDIAGYAQLVENILNGKPANGVVPPGDEPRVNPTPEESPKPSPDGDEQELEAWKKFIWPRPTQGYPRESFGDPFRGPWRITVRERV